MTSLKVVMSRSGYSDEGTEWAMICYRGAVCSSLRGKRGQAFLRELCSALDALPEKSLCTHYLQLKNGKCCAIGAVGKARGIDMTNMDAEAMTESGSLSELMDIANAMVREIEFINDDDFWCKSRDGESIETFYARQDRARWTTVRNWAEEQINAN